MNKVPNLKSLMRTLTKRLLTCTRIANVDGTEALIEIVRDRNGTRRK